ncbi:X-ray radiation resistance-associated protein 1 [Elysia marginata]|uniref:X-ray radiation resistance-associated protein 1 n=1 Tax=Elysia marginata TaxID=1093978 RepID=A0AAV4FFB7_9GAST|nr:X-ray radiation resistance-associated protein 1 [Elysia marginata]
MAVAGVKFDDGTGTFASNCFPVRAAFGRTSDEASGAWLIAHHAEQRRRFKAVLCAKPRTYSRLKEERKKSELHGTKLGTYKYNEDTDEDEAEEEAEDDGAILDGFFLMKHCCVEDPADLCSVNIANKELVDVKEEDLALFENVAYVNAGENYLPFEAFRGFPSLRELEIPLNGLRNLKISHTDFTCLEMLDLSYNNLSQDDLLTIGLLSHLKVLHLTGNGFTNLPQDMAMPYLSREKEVRLDRFARLEVLLLDDNKFMDMTVFAALAGLPRLRHLNMAKNQIFFVPQLKSVEGRVVTQDGHGRKRRGGDGRPKSAASGSGRRSRASEGKKRSKSQASKPGTGTEQSGILMSLEEEEAAAVPGEASVQEEKVKVDQDVTSREPAKSEVTAAAAAENPPAVPATPEEIPASDLLNDDFGAADLTARIDDLNLDQDETLTKTAPEQPPPPPKLPPFPELRYLNLADNKICEEDALLAVAAWPMLVELDIQGNPLTLETSGDPPLIRRFLMDRLGIKVNRVKPQAESGFLVKEKVEIRPRRRKVTDVVPKVPKLSLDEKLRLALAPPPAPPKHGSTPPFKERRGRQVKSRSVLPPIPTTPKRELTEAWADKILEEEEEELEEEEDEYDRHRAEDNTSGAFFMTQVEDQKEGTRKARTGRTEATSLAGAGDTSLNEGQPELAEDKKIDDRYKGYELLLDIEELEDEPELPPAKDIQSNIRALKHTLNHMLVYRDPAVELSKVKMAVPEFRRAPVPKGGPHQSYQDRVDNVLENLKTRSTLEEEKLTSVLKDKSRAQRKFPEAEELLGQIQRRYNAVRAHSLKDAKIARNITSEVIDLLPAPTSKQVKTKAT